MRLIVSKEYITCLLEPLGLIPKGYEIRSLSGRTNQKELVIYLKKTE